MKILFLIDSLKQGGKERQLIELLKGLEEKKDVTCELVVLSDEVFYSYVKNLKIKMHLLPRKCKYDPVIFYKLYKICKDFKPNIVHSWEWMSSIYGLPSVKILGTKFINSTIRNAPIKIKKYGKAWRRSKIIFYISDLILANSHAGLKSYNAPLKKSYYIHNGFDLLRINKILDEKAVRKKFNIKTAKIVGMVAAASNKKDYETFVLAATKIIKNRNDVTFLAVGDGGELEKYKKMVKQKHKEKIKFLGQQLDIESIINVFDVGVLATYTEGISNSIMEYMALGKPVVATKGGGTTELVINGKTGLLVKASDFQKMSNQIEFLLDNKKIAKSFGEAGRERIQSEFNLGKITDQFTNLYRNCI